MMKKMKRIFCAALAAAITAVGGISVPAQADGRGTVNADKTAQWTKQEKAAGYDLRIHGWSAWETAAYIGFTMPDGFNAGEITNASLVLTTISANASGTAYLYAAEYGAFDNGAQYEGTEIPSYTERELLSFTSPVSAGEYIIDVTDYIRGMDGDKAAFRIDVKSQDTNNGWVIGSCTNGGAAPRLVLETGGTLTGLLNGSFSDNSAWTISNPDNMNISGGQLSASGTDYEARLSQTASGIENGVYDLNAYVTNSSTDGICYLYAKTKGHTMASTSVPMCGSSTKITVPNIIVDDGRCEAGLYINGSQSLTLDNVSLTKSDSTRVPFLKGGEISKLTYLEEQGQIKYKDIDGTERDCLQIMAENGFNLARIRLLNNPGKGRGDGGYYLPEGYMDIDDCLTLARRAKDKGMQIEFTFAYSDYWVDGATQMPPADWTAGAAGKAGAALAQYYSDKIYEYTKDVLKQLKAQGTEPEFVSIGNEMQFGMCFGLYQSNNGLYNNSAYIAQLSNAGAKAVREECPNAKIILHSDNGGKLSQRNQFVKALSSTDFDVIGVSFYPYYNADVSIDTVVNEFNSLISKYDKDVIIMETGYNWAELRADGWEGQLQDSGYYQDIYGETEAGQKAFFTELYAKLKQVAGGRCIGDMYWDPVMAYDRSEWTDGKGYNTGWAIRESDDCTDVNVVSNSCLFDFEDRALDAFDAMRYNTDSADKLLVSGKISDAKGRAAANTEVSITVNGKSRTVTTDAYGEYIAAVDYPANEKIGVTASGYEGRYYIDAPQYGILVSGIDFPSARADEIPPDEDKPVPAEPRVESCTTQTAPDGTVTAEVRIANYGAAEFYAMAVMASYDKNGTLISCSSDAAVLMPGGTAELAVSLKDGAKLFVWDGKTYSPISGAILCK